MKQVVIKEISNGYLVTAKYDSFNTKDEFAAKDWNEVMEILKKIGPSSKEIATRAIKQTKGKL